MAMKWAAALAPRRERRTANLRPAQQSQPAQALLDYLRGQGVRVQIGYRDQEQKRLSALVAAGALRQETEAYPVFLRRGSLLQLELSDAFSPAQALLPLAQAVVSYLLRRQEYEGMRQQIGERIAQESLRPSIGSRELQEMRAREIALIPLELRYVTTVLAYALTTEFFPDERTWLSTASEERIEEIARLRALTRLRGQEHAASDIAVAQARRELEALSRARLERLWVGLWGIAAAPVGEGDGLPSL